MRSKTSVRRSLRRTYMPKKDKTLETGPCILDLAPEVKEMLSSLLLEVKGLKEEIAKNNKKPEDEKPACGRCAFAKIVDDVVFCNHSKMRTLPSGALRQVHPTECWCSFFSNELPE
jgi:hypothetical protein